jgi:hypothetical protein
LNWKIAEKVSEPEVSPFRVDVVTLLSEGLQTFCLFLLPLPFLVPFNYVAMLAAPISINAEPAA